MQRYYQRWPEGSFFWHPVLQADILEIDGTAGPNYAYHSVKHLEEGMFSDYMLTFLKPAPPSRKEVPILPFTQTILQTELPFLDITPPISSSKLTTKTFTNCNYLHVTSVRFSTVKTTFLQPFSPHPPSAFRKQCKTMTTFFNIHFYSRELLRDEHEMVSSCQQAVKVTCKNE